MARSSTRIAAVLGLAALTVAPAAAATAASGQAGDLAARQAVLTAIDPTGAPTSSRVFTQVSGQDGEVSLADAPTGGLRNLNGFGAPRVVDGRLVLAGDGPQRTVADYDADQPVSIEISYELDGEVIDGPDVAGRSGVLTTTIVVTNRTAQPTDLTWKDAAGVARTETVDVSVPLVGSMSTVLDSRFVGVDAPGAVVAADGRGSTVVNWSLLLFAPLGDDSATLSWTARVTDAVLPQLTAQVLPVDSSSFASLANAEETYRGASDDTYALTQGAVTIDRNLLRLATGASTLLDGVVRLADGSRQLADGLGDAADGSGQLSDGLGKARAGGGQLADGLGDLSEGAGKLSDGLGSARAGGGQLADGLAALDAGAAQLSGGLGSANAGGAQLSDGLVLLDAGAGQLLAGLELLKAQVNDPVEGLPAALDGIELLAAGTQKALAGLGANATPTPGTVAHGLASVRQVAQGMTLKANTDLRNAMGGITGLYGPNVAAGITSAQTAVADLQTAGALTPEQAATVTTPLTAATANLGGVTATAGAVAAGIGTVRSVPADCGAILTDLLTTSSPTTLTATQGLDCIGYQLQAGIDNPNALSADGKSGTNRTCADTAVPADKCGLRQGLQLVAGGLGLLDTRLTAGLTGINAGLGDRSTPGKTLIFGAASLAAGATKASAGGASLADGLAQLDAGGAKLADGAGKASAGSTALVDGLVQLDDGGQALAAGAGKAAAGGSDLLDGLVQLDDGGAKLADGLVSAEDGAVQVADGLALARIGAGQVADGAGDLQSKGTSVLADEVNEAAAGTNRTLAWLQAADARGRGEALPYPAADGAAASIVYQYELAGVSTDGLGEGSRSVLAIGLLGGAAGLGLLGRRRLGRI